MTSWGLRSALPMPARRIVTDFGAVSFWLRDDVPGLTSEPEDVRAVLRDLPGWFHDPPQRRGLALLYEEMSGFLPDNPDAVVLEVLPALSRAIAGGRIVVLVEEIKLPGPVMVAPAEAPLPGSTQTPTEDLAWFQARFVDEVGAPIDGLEVTFFVLGSPRKAMTNSAGIARLEDQSVSTATVIASDLRALRDLLRPRWTKPRTPKIPSGPDTFVRELDISFDPVSLDSEVPATIVIAPYFRCREVHGAHFEFGRSFVRHEAIPALAAVAEDLDGEPIRRAMIFGHSDKTGSDALNKELSERRARAVFALLTHDAVAWEELFTNKWSGGQWSEIWGTREVQHMLNALHVPTEDGVPLVEHGVLDKRTTTAIKRFQQGDYPDRPAEQAALWDDGIAGPLTRRELFFAYAKHVTRKPVVPDRIAPVNGEKFMGCGEYNPVSILAKDAESRRVVILLFDIAAEPQGLPCKLHSVAPCKANLGPEVTEVDPAGKPPYRCKVYQDAASRCPCQGGVDLNHDLILRLPLTLQEANTLPHVFVLESEDGTIRMSRTLAADARAAEEGWVALYFPDLPPAHHYRMQCTGVEDPYEVFDLTPYQDLHTVGHGGSSENDGPFLPPSVGSSP